MERDLPMLSPRQMLTPTFLWWISRTRIPWSWIWIPRISLCLLGQESADAEPKAEADPYLLYGGYHGLGYARYGLHYPAYGGYA